MKTNKRLYVDVHVLQSVPPSCVNRDDTGSPKSAIYGGATRARVSSQCWKKAMRNMFNDIFPQEVLARRTKRIVGMVADQIQALNGNTERDEAEALAEQVLKTAGLNIKSVDKGTDALFFMSIAQAKALAELVENDPEVTDAKPTKAVKNKVQSVLKAFPGIEIALFGRMVADDPSLNTDACAQVAHSISTHKVVKEYDYFTAVDDLSPDDTAGAGHIDTVEYNSATLYRYATVAAHDLLSHLGDETAEAVRGFVHAFVCAMPTGKQNTFANRTVPAAVLITLRNDQPVNLVGAFERPVKAGYNDDDGYVEASAKVFVEHAAAVYDNWLGKPELSLATGELFAALAEPQSLQDLLKTLDKELSKRLEDSGVVQ